MRTTLDLDDDVLFAAKELAVARGTTAGKVVSESSGRRSPPDEQFDREMECRCYRPGLPARHGPQ